MNGLGPDAARAPNCPSLPAARCAGSGRGWKNAGIFKSKAPALHGRLNATQPGVIAVSILYIRGLVVPCKGREKGVAAEQHLLLFTEIVLKSR